MKRGIIILFYFTLIGFSTLAQHTNADRLYEKGEAALNEGKYQEALVFLNRCLQENPAHAEAYFTRGAVREQLKDLEGALTDYSIYLEMKPAQAEALLTRGRLRYQLGKYEQAKEDFSSLLKINTSETNTVFYQKSASATGRNQIMTAQGNLKPQIFNYLALVEIKLKNFKPAIQWLDSAIHLEDSAADYYVNRGIAKEGIKDASAMADYQRALQLDPGHALALHNIAVAKRKTGDKTHADDIEKAIESDSSMLYPYLERAYQRLEGGYYKGALEDYNSAIAIESGDPEIWLNRGLVKEKLNDLKGAYADYTKAIALKEDFAKAWLNRGNVLTKQGRHKNAVEDYTLAITFNANYAHAYYNRAIAKEKLKLAEEACQDLKKAELLGMTIDSGMMEKICK